MIIFFRISLILMIVLFATHSLADEPEIDVDGFAKWKQELRKEAIKSGIKKQIFDEVLKGVEPDARIIRLDGKQPHRTISFNEYISKVVSRTRVTRGIGLLRKNKKLLKEIADKYGVQERFIVALWGIETDYGRNTGGFYVPEALATLAFDGRRSAFFRKELLQALKIVQEKHISIKDFKGSWAGAMGQSQFMPSSFFKFAEDYNGDGKKDIWTSNRDVFASIANYLSKTKWDNSLTWGRKVKLPEDFDITLANPKLEKTIKQWQKLGVRKVDGSNLPKRDINASIVIPGGKKGDAYMVYENYKTLLDWNRSLYFATAVGLLSDALGGK